jgi:hypothetical protein
MSLDCSEDLYRLGNIDILRHSMHARIYVHTLVVVCAFWTIHCIHPYYFDLCIYTNSDTTLHALTVDTTNVAQAHTTTSHDQCYA